MHVIFVSGIFATHVGKLIKHTGKHYGINYAFLASKVRSFFWPALTGKGAAHMFDPQRATTYWKEDGKFKTQASEALQALPFLEYILQEEALARNIPDLARHVMCFMGLVRIIRTIQSRARGPVDIAGFQRAVGAYLDAYSMLYKVNWDDKDMQPKFHYAVCFAAPPHPRARGLQPACGS